MSEKPKSTFARRVRARKYEIRDDVVTGLGLAVQPTGVRTFVFNRMVRGRRRYATVSRADAMTVPEARAEARKLIAAFLDTAKNDNGPRTPGHPMDAFAAEFLERHARPVHDDAHGRALGISPPQLQPLQERQAIPDAAQGTVSYCRGDGPAQRRAHPRRVLVPQAVAVIRLLMLTGCRFGEVVSLEWDWIRGTRIHLPDSKSGPRTVWLSSAARAVIDAIPRYSPDCPFLFPARPPTRHIDNIEYQWTRIRNEAGLPRLRLHDLRHNWASVAAMNDVDMVTVAKLLGHALVETTERYTHLSDRSVADAVDRVSNRIHAALTGRGEEREGGAHHAHR